MTIDEAIEILTQHQKGTDPLYLPELPEAEKLGIEALKHHKKLRDAHPYSNYKILPGETKPVYRGMTETMFINPERD